MIKRCPWFVNVCPDTFYLTACCTSPPPPPPSLQVARFCPASLAGPEGSTRHITCVCFSRSGELLATYHQGDMYLFEPSGQQQVPAAPTRAEGGPEEDTRC